MIRLMTMDEKSKVKQVNIDRDNKISDLLRDLKQTGFNARRLGLACEIYSAMLDD